MCGMNQTDLRQISLTGSCECGNGRSGSIKGWCSVQRLSAAQDRFQCFYAFRQHNKTDNARIT